MGKETPKQRKLRTEAERKIKRAPNPVVADKIRRKLTDDLNDLAESEQSRLENVERQLQDEQVRRDFKAHMDWLKRNG